MEQGTEPGASPQVKTMSVATLIKPVDEGAQLLWELKDGIIVPTAFGLKMFAREKRTFDKLQMAMPSPKTLSGNRVKCQRGSRSKLSNPVPSVATTVWEGFGMVFEGATSTEDVYDLFVFNPIKKALEENQDTTIFPFGPPGSGKSRLLFGETGVNGIIYHTAKQVCNHIDSHRLVWKYTVTVSVFESISGNLTDLSKGNKLKIGEKDGVFYAKNCKEIDAPCMKEWEKIINRIQRKRKGAKPTRRSDNTKSTVMVRIKIDGRERNPQENQTAKETSTVLLLVDAVAHEQNNIAQSVEERIKKLANTKKSSIQPNTVVKEGSKLPSRRMSAITKLMESSFRGRAKILMICCILLVEQPQTKRALDFGKQMSKLPFYGKTRAPFSLKQFKRNIKEIKYEQKVFNEGMQNYERTVASYQDETASETSFATEPSDVSKKYNHSRPARFQVKTRSRGSSERKFAKKYQRLLFKYNASSNQLKEETARRQALEVNVKEKDLEIVKLLEELEEIRKENVMLKQRLDKLTKENRELRKQQDKQGAKLKVHDELIQKLQTEMGEFRTGRMNPIREELVSVRDDVVLDEDQQEQDSVVAAVINKKPAGRPKVSKNELFEFLVKNYVKDMAKEGIVDELVKEILKDFRSFAKWRTQMTTLRIRCKKDAIKDARRVEKQTRTVDGMQLIAKIMTDEKCSDELVKLYVSGSAAHSIKRRLEQRNKVSEVEMELLFDDTLNQSIAGPSRAVNIKQKASEKRPLGKNGQVSGVSVVDEDSDSCSASEFSDQENL